jgi:hypothetical protein
VRERPAQSPYGTFGTPQAWGEVAPAPRIGQCPQPLGQRADRTTGQAITIEYVAASGSHSVRSLSGLDLDPPYLNAWCHLRNNDRVFTLSRVQGVMPV